jgi:hypothetical protein
MADEMGQHAACEVNGVFHLHVQFAVTRRTTAGPGRPLRSEDGEDETRRNQERRP